MSFRLALANYRTYKAARLGTCILWRDDEGIHFERVWWVRVKYVGNLRWAKIKGGWVI
jgi:hypothetical protein